MRTPRQIAMRRAAPALLAAALSIAPAVASHTVLLTSVPAYPEEAKNGCGPATGQMVLDGYPAGSCLLPQGKDQSDVWTEIGLHRMESSWDTDPAGLRGAMMSLCPPPGGQWSIVPDASEQAVMYQVAFWMTTNSYPVAALLDTNMHNTDIAAHREHWVMIRGVVTDVDPTTTTSAGVNLEHVCLTDPVGVNFGGLPILRCVDAATWYTEFQSVTKPGSAYLGQHVAVIEPPVRHGRAAGREAVLTGTLIGREAVLRIVHAFQGKNACGEPVFGGGGQWLDPFLVNSRYRGYYLVPFVEPDGLVREAALINAYDGSVQETGVFAPIRYLSEQEARDTAVRFAGAKQPRDVRAELVFSDEAGSPTRYHPTWRVQVDGRMIGVTQDGRVLPDLTSADASIRVPARQATGLAIAGDRLWTVDAGSREILELDARTGALQRRISIPVQQPRGLAFDGTNLWVGDAADRQLHAFDAATGTRIRSLPLEVSPEKGYRSLEALAWDGQALWTAIAAGFSSSFNQIDRESGRIVRSIFADCDPRGLAFEGPNLWSLCFNGERNPPTLDRRDRAAAEAEMVRSRALGRKLEGRSPAGLAFDGAALWYVDARAGRVYRVGAAAGERP